MEMTNKKKKIAVAIFFSALAANGQVGATQTEYIYSGDLAAVELKFFDRGEFNSTYDFSEPIINAAKYSASYWQKVLNMQGFAVPWQIALTSVDGKIINAQTFSFYKNAATKTNYLAQMLQGKRTLEAFDLQSLAGEKTLLQEISPANRSAISVVTIGKYLGMNSGTSEKGWNVEANTILPTNEQAADLVGALRLELAHALGAEVLLDSTGKFFSKDAADANAWTFHLVDINGNVVTGGKEIVTGAQLNPELNAADFFVADKVYFVGNNVTRVLNGTTFDGVKGIPLNAWLGSNFDGVQTLISGLMSNQPYKNYTTFTELELAALQDIGYNIDRKKFYGRSVYSSGSTVTNSTNYSSDEDLAVGLHVWSTNNTVNQRGNISLTGAGAVGVRVDGLENKISIRSDIQADKGVLISYGRDHSLDIAGNVTAAGNAVEFNFGSNMLGAGSEYRGSYIRHLRGVDSAGNISSAKNLSLNMADGFNYSADELNGALVNNFNLSGKLSGSRAIYIGKNAFVKNINILNGADIMGNIVSDWKHFTAADGFPINTGFAIRLQYDGKTINPAKYVPDMVTNLNFNADIKYSGDIIGADNIKMHVTGGKLDYWGTADILGVDVAEGAKLFGGTFNLNDMTGNFATGYTDDTTGKFYNHGTIGAPSPDTNLVINGDLISDGILQKVSGGKAGSIIVNGTAYIDGSTVTTDSLLPNETATVLIAESITGDIKNSADNPVPISAMLNATGKIVGNSLTVTTYETNNLDGLNSKEEQTFDAMKNMFETLEEENKQDEMRDLYNLTPSEAKKSLTEIGSNDSAQVMSVAQQSTAVDKMISNRITHVFSPDYIDTATQGFSTDHFDVPATNFSTDHFDVPTHNPDYIEVNVRPTNFADGDTSAPAIKVKVKNPKQQENNFWLNYMKNWGSLRGGTDYHGSAIVGGYDRPIDKKWRAGIFATYGTIGYGAESSRATVYDTRLGLYAGYHNRQSNLYFYVNGGQLRNSLHRGISPLGLSTNAKYNSRIFEIGGEYKYDLTPKKIWHVSPYVNFQTSHLKQNSYHESGAGIYNQHVQSDSNTYFAAQVGLDLKRYYQRGMVGLKFGVKRGFTGTDPDLQIRYEGDNSHSYRLRQERDKTHYLFSLRGENEFAHGWFLGGETEFQLSEHDKDLTASITVRRMW